MSPSQVLRARCEARHRPARHGAVGAGAASGWTRSWTSSTSSASPPTSSPSPTWSTSSRAWGSGSRPAAPAPAAWSTYLLGIADVDPIALRPADGALPLPAARTQLPDIDIDVESARRMEVYGAIIDRFGAERVSCVSMMDTYRVRHAIRDVGAALGLPPGRDRRASPRPSRTSGPTRCTPRCTDLPELRASRLGSSAAAARDLDLLFDLVEPARRPAAAHRPAPVRGAALRRHAARPHAGGDQLPGLSR